MALLYRSYECIQLGLALEIAEKSRRAFPRGEAAQADAVPGPAAGHLSLVDERRVALFAKPSREAVRVDPPLGRGKLKRKAARRLWLELHRTLRRGPLVLRHLGPAGPLPLDRCARLYLDIRPCGFRMGYDLRWSRQRRRFGPWLRQLLR